MQQTTVGVPNLAEASVAHRRRSGRSQTPVGVDQENQVRLPGEPARKVGPPGIPGGKGLARVRGVSDSDGTLEAPSCDPHDKEPGGSTEGDEVRRPEEQVSPIDGSIRATGVGPQLATKGTPVGT